MISGDPGFRLTELLKYILGAAEPSSTINNPDNKLSWLVLFWASHGFLEFYFLFEMNLLFFRFFFLTLWLSHAQAALLHCSETLINPSV